MKPRQLLVMFVLDEALVSNRQEEEDGTRIDISPQRLHFYPIREGESHKDVLAHVGWFDVAVEIEVDASGSALATTKILVNPDSDIKDTDRNRQGFAKMALAA